MEKQAFQLLMDKLQGIDRRLEEGDRKFDQFHETLQENTRELSKHVRGSVATNKRLEIVENKMTHVEDHVSLMERFGRHFKPTKKRMAWLSAAIALFFGFVKIHEYLILKNML